MIKSYQEIKIGQRVKIESIGMKGRITYIHHPDLFNHHLYPIQLETDEVYGDSNSKTYRTNLKDLIVVKKGVKKNGKKKSS